MFQDYFQCGYQNFRYSALNRRGERNRNGVERKSGSGINQTWQVEEFIRGDFLRRNPMYLSVPRSAWEFILPIFTTSSQLSAFPFAHHNFEYWNNTNAPVYLHSHTWPGYSGYNQSSASLSHYFEWVQDEFLPAGMSAFPRRAWERGWRLFLSATAIKSGNGWPYSPPTPHCRTMK